MVRSGNPSGKPDWTDMEDCTDRHILIVVENLPVPLDRRVWLEATTLRRAGYAVSVICPMGQGWTAPFEVISGVHIHRHPAPPEAYAGALAYAREYGLAVRHWFQLARRIWRRRRFDVIQGCNPPDLIFVLALWYRLRGVAYMFDHHDVCPELFEAKFGRRGLLYHVMRIWERVTFATASVSMATNDSFRAIAIQRGRMAPHDVFTVRSAPWTENFIPGPGNREMRCGAGAVMGYVGVIGQQEGMDLLVLAADHLIRKLGRIDVHFLIVGFGPHLDMVRRDVSAHGLDAYFTFTGALYGDDLLAALNVIDIGVSPDPRNAMNDISTMNKVMEYMTLEKPLVQFDLTEGRVSVGDAGLYARANDPVDFAEKIAQLIDDPEGRARMGAIGRRRVLNDLSWAHTEPQLLAAYDRIYAKMGHRMARDRRRFSTG